MDLVVASGYNHVPDVVGQSPAAAKAKLREEGFEATIVGTLQVDRAPPGSVVNQLPLARDRYKLGMTVELTLAAPLDTSASVTDSPSTSPDALPSPSRAPDSTS